MAYGVSRPLGDERYDLIFDSGLDCSESSANGPFDEAMSS